MTSRQKYPNLNLPPIALDLKQEGSTIKVFDNLRQKYVVLTPEEWVRQHFTSHLIFGLHYPELLMANEIGLTLNGGQKRCDTVVFDRDLSPLIIVEYKAPTVKITQTVFDQIARYNMNLKARYLIVSNGLAHYCCKMDYVSNSYQFIPQIPDYREIQD